MLARQHVGEAERDPATTGMPIRHVRRNNSPGTAFGRIEL